MPPFRRAKGQWVKLTRDIVMGKNKETKGTVGILVGPAMQRVEIETEELDKDGKPIMATVLEEIPNTAEVHLVDVPEGTTRLKIAVAWDALAPVTDRKDVPADRLRTMREDWTPVP